MLQKDYADRIFVEDNERGSGTKVQPSGVTLVQKVGYQFRRRARCVWVPRREGGEWGRSILLLPTLGLGERPPSGVRGFSPAENGFIVI